MIQMGQEDTPWVTFTLGLGKEELTLTVAKGNPNSDGVIVRAHLERGEWGVFPHTLWDFLVPPEMN